MRALHVCVYAYVYMRVHMTCMEVCMGNHMEMGKCTFMGVCTGVCARKRTGMSLATRMCMCIDMCMTCPCVCALVCACVCIYQHTPRSNRLTKRTE